MTNDYKSSPWYMILLFELKGYISPKYHFQTDTLYSVVDRGKMLQRTGDSGLYLKIMLLYF